MLTGQELKTEEHNDLLIKENPLNRAWALSKETDDFPSFTSRVRCVRFEFLDQLKMGSKQPAQLFQGHRKGRTASLWGLTRVPRIQVKDPQQETGGPQRSGDCADVITTLPEFDSTKTGVLENPLEAAGQLSGKIKKVRALIGLLSGYRESASLVERGGTFVGEEPMPAR